MRSVTRFLSLISALALVATFALPSSGFAEKIRLGFGGGPEGGTFQYFSNGIASRLSKMQADLEVSNMASAGSVENARRINSGEIDFGDISKGSIVSAKVDLQTLNIEPAKYTLKLELDAKGVRPMIQSFEVNVVED